MNPFASLGKTVAKKREAAMLAKVKILELSEKATQQDADRLDELAEFLGESPQQIIHEFQAIHDASKLKRILQDVPKFEAEADAAKAEEKRDGPELDSQIAALVKKRKGLKDRAEGLDAISKAINLGNVLEGLANQYPVVRLSTLVVHEFPINNASDKLF